MGITTDKNDPRLGRGVDSEKTEMHEVYLVLSEEERAKGFVRPYRDAYTHVGIPKAKYPLLELTPEQHESYDKYGYVMYEAYPPDSEGVVLGRYYTAKDLRGGCGVMTIMGRALSETYARDPHFYGATYCVGCLMHLPVNEFTWKDGERVGS